MNSMCAAVFRLKRSRKEQGCGQDLWVGAGLFIPGPHSEPAPSPPHGRHVNKHRARAPAQAKHETTSLGFPEKQKQELFCCFTLGFNVPPRVPVPHDGIIALSSRLSRSNQWIPWSLVYMTVNHRRSLHLVQTSQCWVTSSYERHWSIMRNMGNHSSCVHSKINQSNRINDDVRCMKWSNLLLSLSTESLYNSLHFTTAQSADIAD